MESFLNKSIDPLTRIDVVRCVLSTLLAAVDSSVFTIHSSRQLHNQQYIHMYVCIELNAHALIMFFDDNPGQLQS